MKIGRLIQEAWLKQRVRNGLRHSRKVAALLNTKDHIDVINATNMIGNSLGKLKIGLSALSAEDKRFNRVVIALQWHARVLISLQDNLYAGRLNPAKKHQWRELIDSSANAVRQATN